MMALVAGITPGTCHIPLGFLAQLWRICEEAQVTSLRLLSYVRERAVNPAMWLPLCSQRNTYKQQDSKAGQGVR
jgi:hypothetical protein